jgi:hypothetical protein
VAVRLPSQAVKRCSKDLLLYYCLTALLLFLRLALHWILLSALRFFCGKKNASDVPKLDFGAL